MFTFGRNGATATVQVNTGLKESDGYATPVFHFGWACGSDWAAILLMHRLWERLDVWKDTLRAESYRRGWADAKAKRAKQY